MATMDHSRNLDMMTISFQPDARRKYKRGGMCCPTFACMTLCGTNNGRLMQVMGSLAPKSGPRGPVHYDSSLVRQGTVIRVERHMYQFNYRTSALPLCVIENLLH